MEDIEGRNSRKSRGETFISRRKMFGKESKESEVHCWGQEDLSGRALSHVDLLQTHRPGGPRVLSLCVSIQTSVKDSACKTSKQKQ